jgi:hypothetical protein
MTNDKGSNVLIELLDEDSKVTIKVVVLGLHGEFLLKTNCEENCVKILRDDEITDENKEDKGNSSIEIDGYSSIILHSIVSALLYTCHFIHTDVEDLV